MAAGSSTAQFERMISQMIAKRKEYSEGLAHIDGLFAKYGIQMSNETPSPARQAQPAKVAQAEPARRIRRRFGQTGDEFVLSIVKAKRSPTTAEINAAWKKSGRAGTADNALVKLVKDKALKRTPITDGRGSNYTLA